MTAKNEVALTIVDPGDRRWAQLVDLDWLVEDVVPLVVKRLELPDTLQYNLTDVNSGNRLAVQETLAGNGIAAGAFLQLSPVRNKLLTDLLDKLYDEAVGYVAKELWGQAEARLEVIRRLDPTYPDPQGVAAALAIRTTAATTGTASGGASQATRGATTGASTTGAASAGASIDSAADASGGYRAASSAGYESASTTSSQTAAATRTASRGLLGCFVATLVLVALAAAAVFSALNTVRNGIDLESVPLIGTLFAGDEALPSFTSLDEPALGTGDVQVTLRWDNAADLDLHVIDPDGNEVYFGNPFVESGGQLDVDANGSCADDPAVENIFWPSGGAPEGQYSVNVVYFGSCTTTAPANYEATISINGQVVDIIQGTLDEATGSDSIGQFVR